MKAMFARLRNLTAPPRPESALRPRLPFGVRSFAVATLGPLAFLTLGALFGGVLAWGALGMIAGGGLAFLLGRLSRRMLGRRK